jgi:hypothetical protein
MEDEVIGVQDAFLTLQVRSLLPKNGLLDLQLWLGSTWVHTHSTRALASWQLLQLLGMVHGQRSCRTGLQLQVFHWAIARSADLSFMCCLIGVLQVSL